MTATVAEDIIQITEQYLGPAADRFVTRQIQFHLNKKPEELTRQDIPKLAEWIKVSLALLTEDKKMVDECAAKIAKLTGSPNG